MLAGAGRNEGVGHRQGLEPIVFICQLYAPSILRPTGSRQPTLLGFEPAIPPVPPYGAFGLIVLVHFLPQSLSALTSLVAPEGYLFIETIGGQGGNWLELPPAGAVEQALGRDFSFCFYKERQVGKQGTNAVSVRLLARKRGLGS